MRFLIGEMSPPRRIARSQTAFRSLAVSDGESTVCDFGAVSAVEAKAP